MTRPSVLIIEDNAPTRTRLADAVRGADDLDLAGTAGSCKEARAFLAGNEAPSVMLVDIGLPDGSGIDLIRESRALTPPPEAMVISVFGDERHVVAAIEAGATGYLLKDADNVADSIRKLLQGGSPISSSIARHLLKRFREPEATPNAPEQALPSLTPRETDVLKLVAKGFTYAEIAGMLELSVHTVTTHVKNTYRKLEVRSRGEAVFEAVQRGIVEINR